MSQAYHEPAIPPLGSVTTIYNFSINTANLRLFESTNTDFRPGGLNIIPIGTAAGTGCIRLNEPDESTVKALGPSLQTRDQTGCTERERRKNQELNARYRVNPADFRIKLPRTMYNVSQMTVVSFESPSLYNISPVLGNNFLTYCPPGTRWPDRGAVDALKDLIVIELPAGSYGSVSDIIIAINTGLAMAGHPLAQFQQNSVAGRVYFQDGTKDRGEEHGSLDFRHPSEFVATGSSLQSGQVIPAQNTLGWLLGYRQARYTGHDSANLDTPDMYEDIESFPNYKGNWPGLMIDGSYVPTMSGGNGATSGQLTPHGYIAEGPAALDNDYVFLSINDNTSSRSGGYLFANGTTMTAGFGDVIARSPISANSELDFSAEPRLYRQPYPRIDAIHFKILDAKGRVPDLGLGDVQVTIQFTCVDQTPAPVSRGLTAVAKGF